MQKDKSGHFEVLDGFPDDVVAVSAKGRIDHDAYAKELHPMVDASVADDGKVKLFYVLGPEFEGFTAGAAWEDTKLGLSHWSDFERVAVVTDVGWVEMGVKLFAPLMRGRVRVFGMAEWDQAKAWVAEDDTQAVV